jgi:hypothetical protein
MDVRRLVVNRRHDDARLRMSPLDIAVRVGNRNRQLYRTGCLCLCDGRKRIMDVSTPGAIRRTVRGSNSRRNLRLIADLAEELESRLLLSSAHNVMKPDFIVERTSNSVALHGGAIQAAAISAPSGLTPAQIRQAYGFNQVTFGSVAGNGAGQTIALVDAYNDPNISSDLHAFDTAFGLADPTLTVINENGGTSLPRTDPAGPGDSWALEISLDVEWAHAVAPGAKILLVEASSDSNSDLMAAVNTARNYAGVSVVSMSWGGDESSSDPSSNKDFTTPAGHIGVTFLAASGDNGAYSSSGPTKTVDYPMGQRQIELDQRRFGRRHQPIRVAAVIPEWSRDSDLHATRGAGRFL